MQVLKVLTFTGDDEKPLEYRDVSNPTAPGCWQNVPDGWDFPGNVEAIRWVLLNHADGDDTALRVTVAVPSAQTAYEYRIGSLPPPSP